jgi:hypothetical protein
LGASQEIGAGAGFYSICKCDRCFLGEGAESDKTRLSPISKALLGMLSRGRRRSMASTLGKGKGTRKGGLVINHHISTCPLISSFDGFAFVRKIAKLFGNFLIVTSMYL